MQDYLNISWHKFKNDLIKKNLHMILMSMLIFNTDKTCHFVIDLNRSSEMSSNISRKRVRCINNSMPMKIACLCVYMMMNHCLPNSFSLSYNV